MSAGEAEARSQIAALKSKLRAAEKKLLRREQKISKLTDLISDLKDSGLLQQDQADIMSQYFQGNLFPILSWNIAFGHKLLLLVLFQTIIQSLLLSQVEHLFYDLQLLRAQNFYSCSLCEDGLASKNRCFSEKTVFGSQVFFMLHCWLMLTSEYLVSLLYV